MTAIAIDDEPIALEVVCSHAAKVPFLTMEATFTNAFQALTYLQQHKPDLIFLDIKMPDISGIDFLNSLSNPPLVIFTTAYSEHAVKSFELDAIDYLLKPFSLPRFLKACNKAHDQYNLRRGTAASASIFVKDGYEQVKVLLDDILFIEAAGNYTQIRMADNKLISARMPISDMQALLPDRSFIRTHRAFIIARNKITRFDRVQVVIGQHIIPIGTTYAGCLNGIV